MASKGQKKRKQKQRRNHARQKVGRFDLVEFPSNVLFQDGRYIHQIPKDKPDEGAQAALVDAFVGQKGEVISRMERSRARVMEILEQVDSVELLTHLSLTYLNINPDTFKETEEKRSPAHVEYLALQALSLDNQVAPSVNPATTMQLAKEAISLVQSLFEDTVLLWTISSVGSGQDGTEDQLGSYQLRERLSSLQVRGTAYVEHLQRMILGCFGPSDSLCNEELGFTAADVLLVHKAVSQLMSTRMSARVANGLQIQHEMSDELERARQGEPSSAFAAAELTMSPEETTRYLAAVTTAFVLSDSRTVGVVSVEEVAVESGLAASRVKAVLEAFVCSPGDYDLQHHKFPCGTHPLTTKPVLKVADGYFIPVPHTMLDAVRPRIEDLLAARPGAWERYARNRAEFLEVEATRLLRSAFRGSRSWRGIKWDEGSDSSDLDGLVHADGLAIRIQCKSGRITAPVRRGAPERMKTELNKLVGDASSQHRRLAKALEENEPISIGFTEPQARALTDPFQVEVVVTLDAVWTWATTANELSDIGVLSDKDPVPWIVSLTDLMAVVDLLQGIELAHYLLRRQRLERDGRIGTLDELDWVGSYVAGELFFDAYFDGDNGLDAVHLLSHTDSINEWYSARQGDRTVETPKPERYLPSELRLLLARLEEERPRNWLAAGVALIDGGSDSLDLWADGIRRISERLPSKGWSNASQVSAAGFGLTIFVDHNVHPLEVRRDAKRYALKKMVEVGQVNWLVIGEGRDGSLFVASRLENGVAGLLDRLADPGAVKQASNDLV